MSGEVDGLSAESQAPMTEKLDFDSSKNFHIFCCLLLLITPSSSVTRIRTRKRDVNCIVAPSRRLPLLRHEGRSPSSLGHRHDPSCHRPPLSEHDAESLIRSLLPNSNVVISTLPSSVVSKVLSSPLGFPFQLTSYSNGDRTSTEIYHSLSERSCSSR